MKKFKAKFDMCLPIHDNYDKTEYSTTMYIFKDDTITINYKENYEEWIYNDIASIYVCNTYDIEKENIIFVYVSYDQLQNCFEEVESEKE